MKRVRCPKCDNFITFDESKYEEGQSLVFECPECDKQFAIRIGVSKLRKTQKEENKENDRSDIKDGKNSYGSIIVIENVFHYKQIIPLVQGDNVIGRYMKGNNINTPIETVDPSVDTNHCVINVSKDKRGKIKYVLRDGPSNTGTFVDNEILGDRDRRLISDGTVFTIGATSIILHGPESDEQ
ncbi:MAG: FHA domain-containing protein [Prevotella sp.]|jgi:hypothetical protein|nr:FHA domain-containing protein [Prevotella sp.]